MLEHFGSRVILSAMELGKKSGCASGVSCCWSELLKMDLGLLYSFQGHKIDQLIFLHFCGTVIRVYNSPCGSFFN